MSEIGVRLSPILQSMEDVLWEWEFFNSGAPNYTDGGFRGAVKIFTSAMMDKIWRLQEDESIDFDDRVAMVEKCGSEIRALIKTYTNIDTHNLYKDDDEE